MSSASLAHSIGYHSFSSGEIPLLRHRLLEWYAANRRKLPWRGDPVRLRRSDSGGVAESFGAKEKKQRVREKEKNEGRLKEAMEGAATNKAQEDSAAASAASATAGAAAS